MRTVKSWINDRDLLILSQNMNDETLFIRTLDDLHRSINSDDEYEVLRASALIRQLFLDGGKSLFDKVNRTYKQKIEFEVVEHHPPDILIKGMTLWAAIDGIDPRIAPENLPRVRMKRDAFFQMIVAVIEGNEYSVHELILYAANTMGGVHSGVSKHDKEMMLDNLRKLYIFSNINAALLFVSSIGRVILESLKPLQYEVQNLKRFEDKAGLSIHLAIVLFHCQDTENYILDIGTQNDRNRVSIFIDYRNDLTFRYYDDKGNRHMVHAGTADFAFSYHKPTYLGFQIAVCDSELLMMIEAGGWRNYFILPDRSMGSFDQFHFVIGSDVLGNAVANMAIMEQVVYSRVLHLDEQAQLREYLEGRIKEGYKSSIRFEGNKFIYSTGHPNFPKQLNESC